MPRMDFTPRIGPFRFTARMGIGFWSVTGAIGIIGMCCCCGGAFLYLIT